MFFFCISTIKENDKLSISKRINADNSVSYAITKKFLLFYIDALEDNQIYLCEVIFDNKENAQEYIDSHEFNKSLPF